MLWSTRRANGEMLREMLTTGADEYAAAGRFGQLIRNWKLARQDMLELLRGKDACVNVVRRCDMSARVIAAAILNLSNAAARLSGAMQYFKLPFGEHGVLIAESLHLSVGYGGGQGVGRAPLSILAEANTACAGEIRGDAKSHRVVFDQAMSVAPGTPKNPFGRSTK